ncbi:transcription elongation factor NusA [Mycoplasmoides gallisepticum CA06_2006.052-5-2P]|uniref:Transcription termination/antitermination protein NusA n=1 Tax=Mycoplasmoides gallisepticum WI01_2001.043-13-2P TaxID=1159201 RepID=J3T8Z4_MYCGL|nr:transcription termination factor NusA [Mycoplasmoides gallisepticum]ADC31059.1 transcription elongation factor NusA [Mycoplasmoides gallisepticum str. F]AFP75747.1 transcription elongation factor NusA [Mycoplasmoides gallisepticum VA94_7994-1-7P]AFP76514.1 transcription elongation factor NusA [Mycoplasmoides gallisepticum NC95_13295-2-2P]AFP77268.1 transcription elongation factor NusA [Mycoplasmoides gallisepticum NC96_1596-4-2P]AFP78039.1 transcription elongation factor NusA [Mycoplasmoide
MSVDNKSFLEAIQTVAETKNISKKEISTILKDAIIRACAKEDPDQRIDVMIDFDMGLLKIFKLYKVIDDSVGEEEFDEINEIHLRDALATNPTIKVGDDFLKSLSIGDFSRVVATNISQYFRQKLSELVNKQAVSEWTPKLNKIVRGTVEKDENNPNVLLVNLGGIYAYYYKRDWVPNEELQNDVEYDFVLTQIKEQSKSWPLVVSRSDALYVKHVLTENIPEIKEGIVEIKAIQRVAGQKTKVAVLSNNPDIDPVTLILGDGGIRIKSIAANLIEHSSGVKVSNEVIDVFHWNDDVFKLIANACYPVDIIGVDVLEDSERDKSVDIIVEDQYLPFLIGRAGINVRLLSYMTGWSIDFKSQSAAIEDNINVVPLNYSPVDNAVLVDQFKRNSRRTKIASKQPFKKVETVQTPLIAYSTAVEGDDDIKVDFQKIYEEAKEPRYEMIDLTKYQPKPVVQDDLEEYQPELGDGIEDELVVEQESEVVQEQPEVVEQEQEPSVNVTARYDDVSEQIAHLDLSKPLIVEEEEQRDLVQKTVKTPKKEKKVQKEKEETVEFVNIDESAYDNVQNENTSITELIRELDITQTPKKEVKKVVLIQDKKDKDKDKKKKKSQRQSLDSFENL